MADTDPFSGTPPFLPRYLSRDLSWVDFNERVMEEGLRRDLLPLDRFKYLSIVSSNFDEFFMVRVAALKRAMQNPDITDSENLALQEELETIARKVRSIQARQYSALKEEILPDLSHGGLNLLRPENWTPSQKEYLESFFLREVLPILTPLRVEDDEPLPSIENKWIHAAFLLEKEGGGEKISEKISLVRIPTVLNRMPRFSLAGLPGKEEQFNWVFIEDLVLTWAHHLYPGYTIRERFMFTINRDADFSVDEQRDDNFIEAMEEVLEDRETSMVIRMSYSPGSRKLRDYFASRLGLEENDLYEIDGPLNLGGLYPDPGL